MGKVEKIGTILQWILFAVIAGLLISAIVYPGRVASKIEIGMTKAQAIESVGDERFHEHDDLVYLCEDNAWMGCKRARASGAVHFVSWRVGIDTVLVAGFNEQNTVIFTGVGDT